MTAGPALCRVAANEPPSRQHVAGSSYEHQQNADFIIADGKGYNTLAYREVNVSVCNILPYGAGGDNGLPSWLIG